MNNKLDEAKSMRKNLGISFFLIFTLILSPIYFIMCIIYSFKVRGEEWGCKAIDNNKNSWAWIVWFGGYFGVSLLVAILENSANSSYQSSSNLNEQVQEQAKPKTDKEKITDVKQKLANGEISESEAKKEINKILGL